MTTTGNQGDLTESFLEGIIADDLMSGAANEVYFEIEMEESFDGEFGDIAYLVGEDGIDPARLSDPTYLGEAVTKLQDLKERQVNWVLDTLALKAGLPNAYAAALDHLECTHRGGEVNVWQSTEGKLITLGNVCTIAREMYTKTAPQLQA